MKRGLNAWSGAHFSAHIAGSIALAFVVAWFASTPVDAANNPFVAAHDVTWTTLGTDENDSMPIGNGDLAANVWTEQNGDLVVLLAKSDSVIELGELVKLGRVRIHFTESPFVHASDFTQKLHLEDGRVEIRSGSNVVQVWVDANHPLIHIEAKLARATNMEANLEVWRTKSHSLDQPSPDRGGLGEIGRNSIPIGFEADTVLPARSNRIAWYHYNQASIYPTVLQQEHLEAVQQKYVDPLLHRCFGGEMFGPDLEASGNQSLHSVSAARNFRLEVIALTETNVSSPEAWKTDLDSLIEEFNHEPFDAAFAAHLRWWQEFWNRSWIEVSGSENATKVSQGYILQRYMMAASSRGALPTKFNGGLFTVGHDMPDNVDSNAANHGPDFRAWGSNYWNQNNRLLYWPLIESGDFDLLKPWFDMYLNSLPLAKDRTQLYFHHGGASFIETMYFWGLPNMGDFGWDNPSTELKSNWMRFHTQGSLEVIAQMLDEYDVTQDAEFAGKKMIPFADAIATYYDQHWQRGTDGKIRMAPTQSLETYQRDAVNPTPDIAGLKEVLPRLLALPSSLASAEQRKRWNKLLGDLPPIPLGKTAANGKLPPLGMGDPGGKTIILPAESYGKTSNGENPELYVAFPYKLYGFGKPSLEVAQNTFFARRFPQDTCWGQDGPQAAVLGLTSAAQKAVVDEFSNYGTQRFQWFWRAGHDWIPDLDNGGTGMMTLELMLMQTEGRRIILTPAWPEEWNVDFKLHAPYHTVVQGHFEGGKVSGLKVTPSSRAKDVIIEAIR
jgi:hypothetical protein